LYKQKFVACLFVDEETNGSNPIANRLNGLAHLWLSDTLKAMAGSTNNVKSTNAFKSKFKKCYFPYDSFSALKH
jgi:hypothetical protein